MKFSSKQPGNVRAGAGGWLARALLACCALGAPAPAQSNPTPQAAAPGGANAPAAAELAWPGMPANLPPYDDGLRSIVAFAEEGRGHEALLWCLAYLDLELPTPEPAGEETAEEEADGPSPDAPQLPELPPAPELTEAQRGTLHYALAVILAGAPTTEAPSDPTEAGLLDARERWALEHLAQAEGLGGVGTVRSDANFNRGALHAWRGERAFLTILREVAASGGGGAPFPEDSPQREALIAARGEFAAGRDAALGGLRLGWEGLAAGTAVESSDELRTNLEFCQRRLRQIDRLLELPPEEEPPEQEQQEDQPESEESEDSQESEDSEESNESESDGESSDESSESSEDSSDDEREPSSDSESQNDGEPSGDPQPEDPSGDPGDERQRPQGDPDPESLEEREPPSEEPGDADENTQPQGTGEEETEPQTPEAEGSEQAGVDAESTPGGAGQEAKAPPLSEEQVMQLLRRLNDIEKDQERLRALIRGARRVPVEKDW